MGIAVPRKIGEQDPERRSEHDEERLVRGGMEAPDAVAGRDGPGESGRCAAGCCQRPSPAGTDEISGVARVTERDKSGEVVDGQRGFLVEFADDGRGREFVGTCGRAFSTPCVHEHVPLSELAWVPFEVNS